MSRLLNAFLNSVRAWRHLIRHETAFKQEVILFALSLPAGWFLAMSWRGFLLLISSIAGVILVEVLNTGIEAACDAVSREFNIDIQLAKDCGSLAVLLSIAIAVAIWVLAAAERIAGAPL
jgi:diacylglycerol kinase (ATP)